MMAVSQITVCSRSREIDLGSGELKISRDYSCLYLPDSDEGVLPDWDVRGHSIVASDADEVHYTGEVVDVIVQDSDRGSKTRLLCEPPERHEE